MPQCFFFVEQDSPDSEDGTIRSLCVECGVKLRIPGSWFYDGQFGPWTVTCNKCTKTIHYYEENDEQEEKTTSTV
jgi:RNase P subunit RPR2